MLNLPIPATTTKSDLILLRGGLNLVSSALEIKPGYCIDSLNFEPDINGGYRLIDGYERFDGQKSPNDALYYTLYVTPSSVFMAGVSVYGVNGSAYIVKLEATKNRIILTNLVGSLSVNDALSFTNGGETIATATSSGLVTSEEDYDLNAEYTLLAQNYYRNFIGQVPGINAVRGVWKYNAIVYAFRDSLDGIFGGMWKQSTTGWTSVDLGNEIAFNSGLIQIQEGMTITGGTSGATAIVKRIVLEFGTWGTTARGRLMLSNITGAFVIAETLKVATVNYATIGTQLQFTSGISQVNVGDTVTGVTSLATGVVTAVIIETGTWANANVVGRLVLTGVTGAFNPSEVVKVGTINKATLTAIVVQIAHVLKAGGRYEFDNKNFTGSSSNYRMYGCNGANPAFEFDGETFIPIHSGMETDTPVHIKVHKRQLFLAFKGSAQHSGIGPGNQYLFTLLTGASELGVGDDITGFLVMTGSTSSGALAIYTKNNSFILYGNSAADWNLVTASAEAGAIAYTAQNIDGGMYLDKHGIYKQIAVQGWGNFEQASISRLVQPLINSLKLVAVASNTLRSRNQYRVYGNDGTGLIITMNGALIDGMMPFDLNLKISCVCTADRSDEESDEVYYGASNGFVYKMTGGSFDGDNMDWRLTLPFNNIKSPSIRKKWRRVNVGIKTTNAARINFGFEIGYADTEIGQPVAKQFDLKGSGGKWDSINWDSFTWDSKIVNNKSFELNGTAENISLYFIGSSATILPFTLQSAIFDFTARRITR